MLNPKKHVYANQFSPTKKKQLMFDVVILQNLAGMEAFTRPDAQIWLSPAESQQLRRPCDKSEQWPVGSPGVHTEDNISYWGYDKRIMS